MTDSKTEHLLRKAYEQRFVPLAEQLRSAGVAFFALGPDPAAGTYYVRREGPADYVTPYDSDRLASELRTRWSGEGIVALSELAEVLGDIAERLEDVNAVSEDVSPYIYAMF